jgi:hypothetical protein
VTRVRAVDDSVIAGLRADPNNIPTLPVAGLTGALPSEDIGLFGASSLE